MTEKRFEEVYGEMGLFRVKDNKTGKYYKAVLCGNHFTETDKPILDVLNEIADENEQLKTFLEALKEELSLADRDNTLLEKENEHIKHIIKTMMENERTELGKNCLKQLYEAIQ